MLRDIRVALRSFAREPGFAAVLVLTIAVGIGATTAIVSVVHAVMLKPLPYRDPSSLVRVFNRQSFPDMEDWIAQNQTVETFGGYNGWASDVLIGDATERIQGAIVTGSLLPMMGVAPRVGRLITPEDNVQGGGAVVALSHDFWTRRFAADPEVIGATLSMSGRPTTVIGIMPESFRLPLEVVKAQYWLPHRVVSPETAAARGVHFLISIGRLREGLALDEAQADMDVIAARLEALYPEENTDRRFVLAPWRIDLASRARPALMLLLGAVALVLLIVCANVAGLLLARTAKRKREMALRTALGASGLRIVRQLLVESMLFGVIGGAAGLLVASFVLRLIVTLGPDDVPRLSEAALDPIVLSFSLALSRDQPSFRPRARSESDPFASGRGDKRRADIKTSRARPSHHR